MAGGLGSRLYPLTTVTNKHLLPIYNKPMIFYPLYSLIDAGIKEILIISGPNHMGAIFELLGSGKDFDCDLTYRVQDTAGGLPHAINVAKHFVNGEKFVSMNGDNIIIESIKPFVKEFEQGKELSRVVLTQVSEEEAKQAGVAELDQRDNVTGFEEKPKIPKSNWAVIGCYMYTPEVFEVIKSLKPSARGELEITDLHNHYLKQGALKASKLSNGWKDAGTFDELVNINLFMQHKMHESIFKNMKFKNNK